MAEGGLISVELRAYRLTHDARYLQSATQGFHVMTQPLAQGGTLDATGNAVWFEEYPQLPATHVLNGHIYALFGLFDYYRVDR